MEKILSIRIIMRNGLWSATPSGAGQSYVKASPCKTFRMGLKEVPESVSIGMLFAYRTAILEFLSERGMGSDD